MDDALRQQYLAAQAKIESERARRGISARAARPKPKQEDVRVGDYDYPAPASFTSIMPRIPELSPEEEAAENARRAEEKAKREAKEQAEHRRKREKRVEALKLPVTEADERMLIDGTITQTKMVAIVRNWLASDKPWLTLCGTVGRGKTMAAAWAAVEQFGRYMPARELERLFAARYGTELEAQEQLLSARFLVVDDIGREREPGGMTTALLELIDQRRKAGRRTIAISNLSKPDFLERYQDERLHSRLHESGTWGVNTGEDMRKGRVTA